MIYLFLAAFIWSTSFIAGKYAYAFCDPYVLVQLRLLISALVLFPLWRKSFKRLPRELVGHMVFLAFLNAATFLLQFVGLSLTSASSAVAMLGVEPIMVIFVGVLFFKESTNLWNMALGALAFLGVWVIVGVPHGGEVSLLGCLLVLASTVATATWVHISKRILYKLSSVDYTVINVVLSTIACVPFTIVLNDSWKVSTDVEGVLAIIYLAVVCSLGALWLWNKGLQNVNANYTGVFLAMEPAFGVVLSALILKEVLPISTIVGTIMVLLAATITPFVPQAGKGKDGDQGGAGQAA